MKIIFRPHYKTFDTERFDAACQKLLLTQYKKWASNDEAPEYTDCVTALRWLLHISSDMLIPRAYIWDLSHEIATLCDIIPLSEAQIGDIIFFEKMSKTHKKYMVTHVGMMVDNEHFIHASLRENGKISSIHDILYTHDILEESFLSLAHDPRHHA